MDAASTRGFVDGMWNDSILSTLTDYIRIPNKSPLYDPAWVEHGHMDRAVELIETWCRAHALRDMSIEVVRLAGRTPLLIIDIPGESEQPVLLYGHLDKQPETSAWRPGLGPWTPVLEGERLYGRGGADDGYAAFAALTAASAVRSQRAPHARCVILIEACEESGSYDLPFYVEHLAERLGRPSLVVCLDSGCGNYDQLWGTTSLRGLVAGDLTVEVLTEAVHSGDAGGMVPSTFSVLRLLLDRLEDARDGTILPRDLHVQIPRLRAEEAAQVARILGDTLVSGLPLHEGARPLAADATELILNRTWRPALEITGAEGLPALEDAANVVRPVTSVRISLRIPPGCDPAAAAGRLKELFETDPPHGARVRFEGEKLAAGWNAPEPSRWLAESVERASRTFFGREAAYMGEGGTIPFIAMLGERFPEAEFLVTGVLGPESNAHGPNEFLHIPTAKRLTAAIAHVIADHGRSPGE
jgi:acetylornithine deacetylase/succinyl-diaminopimelate desuccinylase-like protein